MYTVQALVSAALLAGDALASGPLRARQSWSNTATVQLGTSRGSPNHLASGFIYGLPDSPMGQNPNQIPDHFYTDIGFNYGRAGGAQIGAPGRGWIWGISEYNVRFESTLQNYQTTRKYGGNFILLPHDIWGTDHVNSSTQWPGDNGDWRNYDAFLDQLLGDLKNNNMLGGLVFDVWNEPDVSWFWNRSQQQWIDMYIRTHKRIRQDPALSGVQISGPTLANRPASNNPWWTNWLSAIGANNAIPDQYAYHMEGSTTDPENDLQNSTPSLATLLTQYGLPQARLVNINEYGGSNEQVPAGAAWWISRFERYDTVGLRGNWMSNCMLHDLFANLLTRPGSDANVCADTDYAPAPEYWVYKYYAQSMTGTRVGTTGSGDRVFDVYATRDNTDGTVRVLAGARIATGKWYVTVDGLAPAAGSVSVRTYAFRGGSSIYAVAAPPQDLGVVKYQYSGGALTLAVDQTDTATAWAFEIVHS